MLVTIVVSELDKVTYDEVRDGNTSPLVHHVCLLECFLSSKSVENTLDFMLFHPPSYPVASSGSSSMFGGYFFPNRISRH